MPQLFAAPTDPTPLLNRLRGLRLRLRLAAFVRGTALSIGVPLLGLLLLGGLDYLLVLPVFVRAIGLVTLIGLTMSLVILSLLRPFATFRDDFDLVIRLERSDPRFNDSLASSIQFLEADHPGGSRQLREATLKRALVNADYCEFTGLVPVRSTLLSLMLAVVTSLASVALVAVAPMESGRALNRIAAPFAGHHWTDLIIVEPDQPSARIAKGQSATIRVQVKGVLPETVWLDLWLDDSQPISHDQTPQDGAVTFLFEPSRIPKSFRYRVRAHDAVTPWHRVAVLPPPVLVPLDGRPSPQVRLHYPRYTRRPSIELPAGTPVMDVLVGTRVSLRALADRPLAEARRAYRPTSPTLLPLLPVATLATDSPFAAAQALFLTTEAVTDQSISLDGERRLLEFDFVPRLPGRYEFQLVDQTGLPGRQTLDIRIRPDRSPIVRLDRPHTSIDLPRVLPDAVLPLVIQADDPDFGLRWIRLEYRFASTGRPRQVPLYQAEPLAAARALIPWVPDFDLMSWHFDGTLDLSGFTRPDGSPLKPGDRVHLRATATDFDDVTPFKPVGQSDEVVFEIVSPSVLEATLQEKTLELRPELSRLLDQQSQARQRVTAVREQLQKGDGPRPEDFDALRQAEDAQKQVLGRLSGPGGLRETGAQLRRAIEANPSLPETPGLRRIRGVAAELDDLATETVEPIAPMIEAGRRQQEQAPMTTPADDPLARAEQLQRRAEEITQAMLRRLDPWSGAGQASGQARRLREDLKELNDQTDQLRKKLPAGESPDDLPADQRNDLRRTADRQAALAERVGELLDQLNRLAREKEEELDLRRQQLEKLAGSADASDRLEASRLRARIDDLESELDALRRGLTQAVEGDPNGKLNQATEQIRRNQLGAAGDRQSDAQAELGKLIDALREPTEQGPDRLQKKRAQVADQLRALRDAQRQLQDRVTQADMLDDPAEREQALAELAREQERLRRLTRELRRESERPDDPDLFDAERAMESAQRSLDLGEAPSPDLTDAAERLNDAIRERDQDDPDEPSLDRSKAEEITKRLRLLKERHEALIQERERLAGRAREAEIWELPLLRGLESTAKAQESLAEEVRAIVLQRFENSPVFGRMLGHAAGGMTRARDRILLWRDDILDFPEIDLELEKLAESEVDRHQQLALRRFEQILEALEEGTPPEPEPAEAEPMPMPMPMPEEGDPMPSGLPPLAQLKALKTLQNEVVERMATFAEAHPDLDKLTPEAMDEFLELRQAQAEIGAMFRELRAATTPEPTED